MTFRNLPAQSALGTRAVPARKALMIDVFATSRLTAERIAEHHHAELCRMHQDERVMATLGGTRSAEETRRFVESSVAHWKAHGYGLWMFRSAAEKCFAGRGGLRNVVVGGAPEVELAYALIPEFWGRGLATEMARAILERAFGDLGLANVVSFTLVSNRASQRVMEKAGLRYEDTVVHAGLPHVLYRTFRPGTAELTCFTAHRADPQRGDQVS